MSHSHFMFFLSQVLLETLGRLCHHGGSGVDALTASLTAGVPARMRSGMPRRGSKMLEMGMFPRYSSPSRM